MALLTGTSADNSLRRPEIYNFEKRNLLKIYMEPEETDSVSAIPIDEGILSIYQPKIKGILSIYQEKFYVTIWPIYLVSQIIFVLIRRRKKKE